MKKIIYFVVFIFLVSCSSEKDELKSLIRKSLKEDNTISQTEWAEIENLISRKKDNYPDLFDEDKLNVNAVKSVIETLSNKLKPRFKGTNILSIYNSTEKTTNTKIQVFIENSGSMDGYVRGTTDFEASLSDLLVQLQYRYSKKNLNVNFINSKIYPSKVEEVSKFVRSLEPNNNSPYKVGNTSTSELNEIFKNILSKVDEETIGVLVSDCIYSLGKGNDTHEALEFQKSLTKGVFLEKSKKLNFSTLILKMSSKFTGYYYDKDNKMSYIKGQERPYYFWIIGADSKMKDLKKQIEFINLKGFKNSYYLEGDSMKSNPFYCVLGKYNKIGRFKMHGSQGNYTLEDVDFRNGKFQFSVAVDLSCIPVDKSYLLDKDNYKIKGFDIKSIEEMSKVSLQNRDKRMAGKATHIITLQTDKRESITNITIRLPHKMPKWVKKSNTNYDKNILNYLDKTFGIEYLVKGVTEAYEMKNKNNDYLSITINLKQ